MRVSLLIIFLLCMFLAYARTSQKGAERVAESRNAVIAFSLLPFPGNIIHINVWAYQQALYSSHCITTYSNNTATDCTVVPGKETITVKQGPGKQWYCSIRGCFFSWYAVLFNQ